MWIFLSRVVGKLMPSITSQVRLLREFRVLHVFQVALRGNYCWPTQETDTRPIQNAPFMRSRGCQRGQLHFSVWTFFSFIYMEYSILGHHICVWVTVTMTHCESWFLVSSRDTRPYELSLDLILYRVSPIWARGEVKCKTRVKSPPPLLFTHLPPLPSE